MTKRPSSRFIWQRKYVGYIPNEVQAVVDEVENQGGVAFVTDEYAIVQGGRQEWMGWSVSWLSGAQISQANSSSVWMMFVSDAEFTAALDKIRSERDAVIRRFNERTS